MAGCWFGSNSGASTTVGLARWSCTACTACGCASLRRPAGHARQAGFLNASRSSYTCAASTVVRPIPRASSEITPHRYLDSGFFPWAGTSLLRHRWQRWADHADGDPHDG